MGFGFVDDWSETLDDVRWTRIAIHARVLGAAKTKSDSSMNVLWGVDIHLGSFGVAGV